CMSSVMLHLPPSTTIFPYTTLLRSKKTNVTKSGGEITQTYIQQALNGNAVVLLADEPTTNLDTKHIEWVERKMQEWKGALIIVSHDRAFLDVLCSSI